MKRNEMKTLTTMHQKYNLLIRIFEGTAIIMSSIYLLPHDNISLTMWQ